MGLTSGKTQRRAALLVRHVPWQLGYQNFEISESYLYGKKDRLSIGRIP